MPYRQLNHSATPAALCVPVLQSKCYVYVHVPLFFFLFFDYIGYYVAYNTSTGVNGYTTPWLL